MINTGAIMRTTIDDLKERIQILSFVNYRNELGDILQSEEVVRAECWAKVLAISAGISESGVERTASIGYRIIVRYRDDISPDAGIKWRNKRLRITSTPYHAESRRIWTVLDCIEVVPDGKAE